MRGLAVLVVLLLPAASAGPFLQAGHDAARTGNVVDVGPRQYEVALDVGLPGVRPSGAPPLVIDGAVYTLLKPARADVSGDVVVPEHTASGVFRVDLASGESSQILPLDDPATSMASDGRRLFVAEADALAAYALDGTGPEWRWPWPPFPGGPNGTVFCGPLAVVHDAVHLACTNEQVDEAAVRGDPPLTYVRAPNANVAFVASVDAADGTARWTWDTMVPSPHVPAVPESPTEQRTCPRDGAATRAHAVTVLGDHVLVTASREPNFADDPPVSDQFMLLEFDRETGEPGWALCGVRWSTNVALYGAGEDHAPVMPAVTGDVSTGYWVHDDLEAFDLETGTYSGLGDLGGGVGATNGFGPQNSGTGIAIRGNDLYVQAYQRVFHFDREQGQGTWMQSTDDGGVSSLEPLLGARTLFVPADESVTAHDAATGSFLWKHHVPLETSNLRAFPPQQIAVSEGVLAMLGPHGHLVVIGRTPGSIVPTPLISNPWPAVDEPVRIDLSGSGPGLGGDLEYEIDWGDGVTDVWQSDPDFVHEYVAKGAREARISVRNDAGQLSVETVTFDVGGAPPEDLNFLQSAFARENQDLTFGVLGLAVALAGGLIALAHRRTKRERLQRELDAIEAVYEETRKEPVHCEAALVERKAHCRGLLLDGTIDEPQYAVLESRIHELSRGLRLSALDDRFDFLPHGLVKALRDMLSDGRISAWEHAHVVRALEEDDVLTKRQKQKVRAQVDRWFERDAGVGR